MDNVLIVVDDLEAVKAFFIELGLKLEGETTVEGPLVGKLIGLEDVRATLAMLRTPDGQGIELDKFHMPDAIRFGPVDAPVNTLGIRRIMFAVDDVGAVVAHMRAHGAELIGEMQYEDSYRLAYIRGPEGLSVWVLRDKAGVEGVWLEQLYTFGLPGRSPTGRVVTVVYWALVRNEEVAAAPEVENVAWFPADELPTLAFDHNEIVAYAVQRLRTKLEYTHVALFFLPETFTLAQAQAAWRDHQRQVDSFRVLDRRHVDARQARQQPDPGRNPFRRPGPLHGDRDDHDVRTPPPRLLEAGTLIAEIGTYARRLLHGETAEPQVGDLPPALDLPAFREGLGELDEVPSQRPRDGPCHVLIARRQYHARQRLRDRLNCDVPRNVNSHPRIKR